MDRLVGVGDVHMVKNILEIWKRESISVGKDHVNYLEVSIAMCRIRLIAFPCML